MPIFLRSFFTSFQFCRGRPGLLLKPSGSHVKTCHRSLWWSIRERCPSHLRYLHLIMSSTFGSAAASLTFSFVTLSFHEIPRILRCHLWCAVVLGRYTEIPNRYPIFEIPIPTPTSVFTIPKNTEYRQLNTENTESRFGICRRGLRTL